MSTLPPGLTQAEVDEYAKLDAGIKRLQDRHKELNEVIKQAHIEAGKVKGTYNYGEVVVKMNESNTFDKDQATQDFPVADYPNLYKPVLEPKNLPADIRSQYTSKTARLSVEKVSD